MKQVKQANAVTGDIGWLAGFVAKVSNLFEQIMSYTAFVFIFVMSSLTCFAVGAGVIFFGVRSLTIDCVVPWLVVLIIGFAMLALGIYCLPYAFIIFGENGAEVVRKFAKKMGLQILSKSMDDFNLLIKLQREEAVAMLGNSAQVKA